MAEKNSAQLEEYLYVGLATLFDPNAHHGGASRFRTLVRGWQRDRFLMMDWPSVEEKVLLLRPDKQCVVQFFNKGRACGFNTQILDTGSSRQPCFRIEWPSTFEVVAIRQHERAPVNVSCWITDTHGATFAGILRDLSAGGCGVVMDTPLAKGASAKLRFALNKVTAFDDVEVVVRSFAEVSDGTMLGMQFVNMSEVVADQIELYVAMALGQLRNMTSTAQRVLIFEGPGAADNPVRDQLEALGYEVTSSSNLVDGFYQLKLLLPDLLIIRQDMPDMTGDAICRIIRKSHGCEALPLLVHGASNPTAKTKAEEAGATGYLSDIAALVQKTAAILKEAAPAGPVPVEPENAAEGDSMINTAMPAEAESAAVQNAE
ncbi:MAG: hypothetical protein AMXMBFR84_22210 [Candidatus Hydrogenedentota bacterium]